MESFEDMLTGGHPNSLGRTVEVVDCVLADPPRIEDLYACYHSTDEVVRLRVSNALRRVEAENHGLLVPLIDRLIEEIGALDQPSAQWTLAKLFEALWDGMSAPQKTAATAIMQRNLAEHDDWIVLNNSMQVLFDLSRRDDLDDLKAFLRPHLTRLQADARKSVASRARKLLARL